MALNKSVDSASKFNIGSVTKSFTAALLGILLHEKGLNWSVPVMDILGQGYGFVDVYRTKKLTLRDLLSHRTGLAGLDGVISSGIPKTLSRMEYCKRMKYLPEQKPIRDVFIYNNLMYMMLGHVAEVLGKDTWENLVTKMIFEPLGMNDTTIMTSPADIAAQDVAQPYIYLHGKFVNGTHEIYGIHPAEPAGAILSTAKDMAKWVKFQLTLGKTESGVQLIDKKLMVDMHRLTTAIPLLDGIETMTKPTFPADDIVSGYGYGWFISEYRGFRNIWHSGGLASYRTMLWTFPDTKNGLFASINGPPIGMDAYLHRIVSFYFMADHLLGLTPWLNETTACSFPEPWDHVPKIEYPGLEKPVSVANLNEFVGTYTTDLLPDVEVSSNSTTLLLKSNRIRGVLHPSSAKDRFLFEVMYPLEYALVDGNGTNAITNVTFNRDATSRSVNSMTLQFEVDVTYSKNASPQIVAGLMFGLM